MGGGGFGAEAKPATLKATKAGLRWGWDRYFVVVAVVRGGDAELVDKDGKST